MSSRRAGCPRPTEVPLGDIPPRLFERFRMLTAGCGHPALQHHRRPSLNLVGGGVYDAPPSIDALPYVAPPHPQIPKKYPPCCPFQGNTALRACFYFMRGGIPSPSRSPMQRKRISFFSRIFQILFPSVALTRATEGSFAPIGEKTFLRRSLQ